METYEYIEEFKIRYADVDFKDEVKASSVLALMQEVASESADELGFGYSYINPKGYAFVLSNLRVEFTQPIPLGEVIRLRTWPTVPTHVVFGREYLVESKAGELLARGSSRWCLIERTTGKILHSKMVDNQNYDRYNTNRVFESDRWKLPVFTQEEGENCFSLKIANSEYDHNDHVNNTRYADYCINCFTVAELRVRWVKTFSISYIKQCREGETLRFFRKNLEEGKALVQGYNEVNEVVVRAEIGFEEKV